MSSALGNVTNELTLVIREICRYKKKISNWRLGIYTGFVILCVCLFSTRQKLFFSKVHEFPCESTGRKVYVRLRLLLESNAYLPILFLTNLLSS